VAAAVCSKPDFWSLIGAVPEIREPLQATVRARLAEIKSMAPESAFGSMADSDLPV
jgi:hypothetical protein